MSQVRCRRSPLPTILCKFRLCIRAHWNRTIAVRILAIHCMRQYRPLKVCALLTGVCGGVGSRARFEVLQLCFGVVAVGVLAVTPVTFVFLAAAKC